MSRELDLNRRSYLHSLDLACRHLNTQRETSYTVFAPNMQWRANILHSLVHGGRSVEISRLITNKTKHSNETYFRTEQGCYNSGDPAPAGS